MLSLPSIGHPADTKLLFFRKARRAAPAIATKYQPSGRYSFFFKKPAGLLWRSLPSIGHPADTTLRFFLQKAHSTAPVIASKFRPSGVYKTTFLKTVVMHKPVFFAVFTSF
jgi:hypothetical protein